MRGLSRLLLPLIIGLSSAPAAIAACHGRFPNPVTDICWECIFPLRIGPTVSVAGNGEDTPDFAPLVCACPTACPPCIRVGMGTSFWEPARVSEVTRTPFCSPLLGGTKLASIPWVKDGNQKSGPGSGAKNQMYHVHWMLFPVLNFLGLTMGGACQTPESFDVGVLSELEPTWGDDELSMLFSPEAILFATPPLIAACAADCLAASFGFPLDFLFWCAGCQGGMYPMSGNTDGQSSGIDGSLLATYRMHAKLHRAMIAWDYGSSGSLCVPLANPFLPKSHYKTQMIYPIPTARNSYPYGRSAMLWQAGKEYPAEGEDFAYMMWRKRVCCMY